MRVDFTNADVTDAKHAVGRPVKASATSFNAKGNAASKGNTANGNSYYRQCKTMSFLFNAWLLFFLIL